MGNWQALAEKKLGLTSVMSQVVLASLNPLDLSGPGLVVGSDYSGSHAESGFDVYAMLILDRVGCRELLSCRAAVSSFVHDRRISYKGLNDRVKRRALIPYLACANQVRGLCVAIAVSKSVGTLFEQNYDGIAADLFAYLEWNRRLLERALRVIHFVSFFTAGLTLPGQDVHWFTDEDDIAANDGRLTLLTKLWANVFSHYAVHDLGHIRCGTTKCDDGSNRVEDLTVIPDLVAGALSDLLTRPAGEPGMA